MNTIRDWLTRGSFNWDKGRIIYQATDKFCGWDEPLSAEEISKEHPILDHEFNRGFGAPECPRFIAEDEKALYFPEQYDGATSLTVVYKDIDWYLDAENPTPYPGG